VAVSPQLEKRKNESLEREKGRRKSEGKEGRVVCNVYGKARNGKRRKGPQVIGMA